MLDFAFTRMGTLDAIARALAGTRGAESDLSIQKKICCAYGIPLEEMTEDEARIVERMASDYAMVNSF